MTGSLSYWVELVGLAEYVELAGITGEVVTEEAVTEEVAVEWGLVQVQTQNLQGLH